MCRGSLLLLLLLAVVGSHATEVHVSPSDCPGDNCFTTLATAVDKCRQGGGPCTVTLSPGHYRIVCPPANRSSTTQTEAPAVDLSNTTDMTFGGADPGNRPRILADYVGSGCAAVAARNAVRLRLRNLELDAYRIPYTTASILSAGDGTAVSMEVEDDPGYVWDTQRYPWLTTVLAATLVTADVIKQNYGTSLHIAGFVDSHIAGRNLTLMYPSPDAARAGLAPGDRLYMKNIGNLQAWGIYTFGCTNVTVDHVDLFSTGGMGFRGDFGLGTYALLSSAATVPTDTPVPRPCSTTADASHWMHHRGHIQLTNTTIHASGDDSLNVHGAYIVISGFPTPDRLQADVINHQGAGWVDNAITYLIGDSVTFSSRSTLQSLGSAVITATTVIDNGATVRVTFDRPVPAKVLLFDMFISDVRVTTFEAVETRFVDSAIRGMVLSVSSAVIRNCTFAQLQKPGVIMLNGGVGNFESYFEGPLTSNVLIENSTFENVATEDFSSCSANNQAAVQVSAVRPVSLCGSSRPWLDQAVPGGPVASTTLAAGSVYYTNSMYLDGGANVSALDLYLPASLTATVTLGLYNASSTSADAPWKPASLLSSAVVSTSATAPGWASARLPKAVRVPPGAYFVAVLAPQAGAVSVGRAQGFMGSTPGHSLPASGTGLPWTTTGGDAIAVGMTWAPAGGWCNLGGTMCPANTGSRRPANRPHPGCDVQPGTELTQGQVYANYTLRGNTFITIGQPRANPAVLAGAMRGISIEGNVIRDAQPSREVAIGLFDVEDARVDGNRCFNGSTVPSSCVGK